MDGPDFGGDHSAFKNRPSGQGQGRQTSRSNRNDPFPLVIQEAQPTPTSTNAYKSKPEIDFYSFSLERVKYIKNETNGEAQFVRHLWMYLGNTIFFILFLVIMMFLPISMIVIGAIYKDDCPRERNIPIYLIVGGVFGFIRNCMEIVPRIILCCGYEIEAEDEEGSPFWKNALRKAPSLLINVFLLAWFIAGCVWVYTTVDDFSTDPNSDDYCHYQLFRFTFWVVNLTWILLGLAILTGCCILPCVFCLCCRRNVPE